ncbi:hypothetical protein LUCX_217 [Xanthomonas phage vB_XciM_LucasX]|nr:hypothetical protein LUCX_217 [Xanthomonas phage vB_XciM_LucasX]
MYRSNLNADNTTAQILKDKQLLGVIAQNEGESVSETAAILTQHLNNPLEDHRGYQVSQVGFGFVSLENDDDFIEGEEPAVIQTALGQTLATVDCFASGVAITNELNRKLSRHH